ncbi:hypothetical protein [Nocardia sp. NPDC019395]
MWTFARGVEGRSVPDTAHVVAGYALALSTAESLSTLMVVERDWSRGS